MQSMYTYESTPNMYVCDTYSIDKTYILIYQAMSIKPGSMFESAIEPETLRKFVLLCGGGGGWERSR